MFFDKLFLGQVSVIANDMVFLKNEQLFIGKMAWI